MAYTADVITNIKADNRDFIRKSIQTKNEVKSLAKVIESEYGVAAKEANALAAASLRNTAMEAKRTTSVFRDMGKELVAAFTAGAVIKVLKDTAESLDDLIATADKLNIEPESFRFLEYAAKRADVEVGTLENTIKKLRVSIAKGLNPDSKQAGAFEALGLDVNKLKSQDIDKSIEDIATSISSVGDSISQVDFVNTIFGKGGQDSLNFLRSNLKEVRKEFEGIGGSITKEDVAKFAEYDKITDQLGTKLKLSLTKAFLSLVPAIKSVVSNMVVLIEKTKEYADLVSKALPANTADQGNIFTRFFNDQLTKGMASSFSKGTGGALSSNFSFGAPITDRPTTVEPVTTPIINATSELTKLAASAAVASQGLQSFKDFKLKDLLGIGKQTGKSYLASILTEKPQATDERFTRIANEIRDAVAGGDKNVASGGSIQQAVANLARISESYGYGYSWDMKGNAKETTNSGMVAAVKELEKLTAQKEKKQEVNVTITVDKNGLLTAFSDGGPGNKLMMDAVKKAAAQEARAVSA